MCAAEKKKIHSGSKEKNFFCVRCNGISGDEGLFGVKIKKMAQGSDDLSTLPLNNTVIVSEKCLAGSKFLYHFT